MLFFIFIIITILGIVGAIIFDEWDHSCLNLISSFIAGIGIIAVVISLSIIVCNCASANAKIAANQQIYNSLVYQYENEVFNDDDDVVGKKELYNQIQDWNKDLAYYKSAQDDFWIGIYIPNIYDQFEFIEYTH